MTDHLTVVEVKTDQRNGSSGRRAGDKPELRDHVLQQLEQITTIVTSNASLEKTNGQEIALAMQKFTDGFDQLTSRCREIQTAQMDVVRKVEQAVEDIAALDAKYEIHDTRLDGINGRVKEIDKTHGVLKLIGSMIAKMGKGS